MERTAGMKFKFEFVCFCGEMMAPTLGNPKDRVVGHNRFMNGSGTGNGMDG